MPAGNRRAYASRSISPHRLRSSGRCASRRRSARGPSQPSPVRHRPRHPHHALDPVAVKALPRRHRLPAAWRRAEDRLAALTPAGRELYDARLTDLAPAGRRAGEPSTSAVEQALDETETDGRLPRLEAVLQDPEFGARLPQHRERVQRVADGVERAMARRHMPTLSGIWLFDRIVSTFPSVIVCFSAPRALGHSRARCSTPSLHRILISSTFSISPSPPLRRARLCSSSRVRSAKLGSPGRMMSMSVLARCHPSGGQRRAASDVRLDPFVGASAAEFVHRRPDSFPESGRRFGQRQLLAVVLIARICFGSGHVRLRSPRRCSAGRAGGTAGSEPARSLRRRKQMRQL